MALINRQNDTRINLGFNVCHHCSKRKRMHFDERFVHYFHVVNTNVLQPLCFCVRVSVPMSACSFFFIYLYVTCSLIIFHWLFEFMRSCNEPTDILGVFAWNFVLPLDNKMSHYFQDIYAHFVDNIWTVMEVFLFYSHMSNCGHRNELKYSDDISLLHCLVIVIVCGSLSLHLFISF